MTSKSGLQGQRHWCKSVNCRQQGRLWRVRSWPQATVPHWQLFGTLTDDPPTLRDPLPPELVNFQPTTLFELDEDRFLKNLRSSRRGAAPGPSGMTNEHLRPLLDDARGRKLLFAVGEQLARAAVPPEVVEMIRGGRLTALSKPDGGVRGIVVGDIVRRLVSRTIAQQMATTVEKATAPYQYALSTRAGCECIAHALQGLTELNPEATVTSIDGIGAFDLISREAMLTGLRDVVGGSEVLPFVRMFYGTPSEYLWEDDDGEVHKIAQGEGGEQGDPMMPLLYSLGQHRALEAIDREMGANQHLMAFLDDIFFVTMPREVGEVYAVVQEKLWIHSCIRVHVGKTKVWNRAGIRPLACDMLERIARVQHPSATVWRGSDIPTADQGIKVLGTPLGHPDFVARHLQRVEQEQQILLDRIPSMSDVQSAWLLLLHCASARANYQLRVVHPSAVEGFARAHDTGLWQCLSSILHIDPAQCEETVRDAACMPLSLGGVGLRSALRTRAPAFWASWSDCLPMIQARNPDVAAALVNELEGFPLTPVLGEAASTVRELVGVQGFEPPSWRALSAGLRPPDREPEEFEPGTVRRGWQHEASSRVERKHREEELFPQMTPASRALIRSQAGPGAGLALSTSPLCLLTRFPSQVFRVILLRRLQLPLPLTARNCRCGHHLDVFGNHRAACARAGVLSRRGFALESVIARVCREAGGRVTTNVLLRDLDLEIADRTDARRLEVAVDGLPLFGGAQLAIDATIVSPLRGDGSARRGAAGEDGVALTAARRRKERRYPELVGPRRRARLLVAGVEVGGRWSDEAKIVVSQLARAKVRQETWLLRRRAEQAWRLRWGSLIACAVARAVALSLLELPRAVGADGNTPAAYDVERDFRHAGLAS